MKTNTHVYNCEDVCCESLNRNPVLTSMNRDFALKFSLSSDVNGV